MTQEAKTFSYYSILVTSDYFTGSQSLIIKVIPEAFDSDPDIYISKV